MALVQIDYPVNLSTQADFDKHGDLIEAGLWDKVDKPLLVHDGVIPQGVVLQIGSDIYHATSDTAITGTASDYVEVTPDGTGGADAAYVATLTGVTWNAQYNGYYNATATSLYLFDEGKAFADGAVLAMFSRYVTRTEDGDTYIGRDLIVDGIDTFGGFHQGTGSEDTELPIGSIVNATVNTSLGDSPISRNEAATVRLYTTGNVSSYRLGGSGQVLTGTWRSRGALRVSVEIFYFIMQRTA